MSHLSHGLRQISKLRNRKLSFILKYSAFHNKYKLSCVIIIIFKVMIHLSPSALQSLLEEIVKQMDVSYVKL